MKIIRIKEMSLGALQNWLTNDMVSVLVENMVFEKISKSVLNMQDYLECLEMYFEKMANLIYKFIAILVVNMQDIFKKFNHVPFVRDMCINSFNEFENKCMP